MNKYLIEILKIQSSVILPGLGALMMPSQKTGKIVFNPHLKFNDGSLAKFISEKEGVENQEAQNKVAKFVREIEADLGKGNSYDLFKFGKFIKNDKGAIDFIMDPILSDAPISDALVDKKKSKSTDKSVKKSEVKKKEDKAKEIEKKTKKVDNKKAPVKKDLSVDKKTPKPIETDSKQSKNKFVPPIEKPIEKIKEITPKVDKEIIKKTATKITDKVKEVLPKNVEAKADNIKSEIKDKAKDVKDKVTDLKDKIISPVKTTEKFEKSKTDTPPIKSVASIIGATAVGAAKSTKEIVSTTADKTAGKIKETIAVKETIKETVLIKEEKKKKSKLPWIILLLLLIGLCVGGYFFRAEIMAFFNKDASNTENVITENNDHTDTEDERTNLDSDRNEDITNADNINAIDSSESDGMASDLIIEANNDRTNTDTNEDVNENNSDQIENTPPPVVNSGNNNGAYHLIGNSFGEESNANKYVKSMQDKGYPAKVLGRFDGLYMVSLKSYDSRSAAKDGRSSVTADASSAWIFKYPK